MNATIITFLCFLCFSCRNDASPDPLSIHGPTMGSTFSIKYFPPESLDKIPPSREIKADIEKILAEIDRQMSTYRPDSEISLFNEYQKTDWFPVSKQFAIAVSKGLAVSEMSQGAFDMTVSPLVQLWGFGAKRKKIVFPTPQQVETAKTQIGYQHLHVRLDPQPALKKDIPTLTLDLSGIAAGFAADRVAEYFDQKKFFQYMIEITGEIRLGSGKGKGKEQKWTIAIERPVTEGGSLQKLLSLSDISLATSGDYHNFFFHQGQRYSHTIDPNSGYPVQHQTASTTVLHPEAAYADAWATALTVLGHQKGMAMAKKYQLKVYFIVRKSDKFEEVLSEDFRPYFSSTNL